MTADEPRDVTGVAAPARPGAEDGSRAVPYLIVLDGANEGELLVLVSGSSYVIGRAEDAEFRVLDVGVSRKHARVTADGDRILVEDLDSRNGTRVNGSPVTLGAPLADGDKISIGAVTLLKFTYHGELPKALYRRSLRDPLTGAYGQRYFEEHLRAELAYTRRHSSALSLIVFDVDHFHSLREAHGSEVTDHVLVEVARRAAKVIAGKYLLARLSTRRFAALCRGLGPIEAVALGDCLRLAIADTPTTVGTISYPVTISGGIASVPWSAVDSPEAFLTMAEYALEDAKNTGRNRVVSPTATPQKP